MVLQLGEADTDPAGLRRDRPGLLDGVQDPDLGGLVEVEPEVAAMVRIALTGRNQTPDLYSITQVLGKDRVTARIQKAIEAVK